MIAISATNPCHLFDLAQALHVQGALSRYYSGYPEWRLRPPAGFPLTTFPARTLATYATLRLPASLRPAPARLFRWQDAGFDRAVARRLEAAGTEFLHAMPGQARASFTAAHACGIRTVLNHASGPVAAQLELLTAEYERAGLRLSDHHTFDAAYFEQEQAEYALADRHCVASRIVRTQLIAHGVPAERIWVVPYAANPGVFSSKPGTTRRPHRVVFAGQITLRKGLRVLLDALTEVRRSQPVELALFGPAQADGAADLERISALPWARYHGPVSQAQLAAEFRSSALLVLPSWEEAFGLVVPQALNCGLPCIVSDRVGAADLIHPRVNGSVFAAGDASALAAEIAWWLEHPPAQPFPLLTWAQPAATLISLSRST